ncbi:MAG: hypothetical protein AAFZ52_17735 [Bacteroidota bacterium]
MTDAALRQQLAPLQQAQVSVSLDTVTTWVQTGRQRPRFHTLVWLTRVGWRLPN